MSPEQARALPVDHLSDLFCFGTLLSNGCHDIFDGSDTSDTSARHLRRPET